MKILIFDFDGTIADSTDMILSVMQGQIKELNREVYLTEMRKYYLTHEVFRRFLRWGYFEFKILRHLEQIHEQISSKIASIKPYSGIREALLQLKKDGVKIFIISSNFRDNIVDFLKQNDLDIFDEVYGKGDLLGKYKTIRMIKNQNPSAEVFYIGDELRDVDAARKAGVNEVGVTWGLNSREDFEEFGTKRILEKSDDLLKL
jgi:phosphoglycolate phosphatase